MRYGLALVGSCPPDALANRMDTHIINPAARRIVNLPLPTRIESLRFVVGAQTFRNLFIVHCAEFIHSALTAEKSQLQERLQVELCALFGANDLQASPYCLQRDLDRSTYWGSSEVPPNIL